MSLPGDINFLLLAAAAGTSLDTLLALSLTSKSFHESYKQYERRLLETCLRRWARRFAPAALFLSRDFKSPVYHFEEGVNRLRSDEPEAKNDPAALERMLAVERACFEYKDGKGVLDVEELRDALWIHRQAVRRANSCAAEYTRTVQGYRATASEETSQDENLGRGWTEYWWRTVLDIDLFWDGEFTSKERIWLNTVYLKMIRSNREGLSISNTEGLPVYSYKKDDNESFSPINVLAALKRGKLDRRDLGYRTTAIVSLALRFATMDSTKKVSRKFWEDDDIRKLTRVISTVQIGIVKEERECSRIAEQLVARSWRLEHQALNREGQDEKLPFFEDWAKEYLMAMGYKLPE